MGSFPNTLVVICHQEFISLSIMLIVILLIASIMAVAQPQPSPDPDAYHPFWIEGPYVIHADYEPGHYYKRDADAHGYGYGYGHGYRPHRHHGYGHGHHGYYGHGYGHGHGHYGYLCVHSSTKYIKRFLIMNIKNNDSDSNKIMNYIGQDSVCCTTLYIILLIPFILFL